MDKADFTRSVASIYLNTPRSDRGLRDVATRVASLRFTPLSTLQEFKDLLEEVPAFTADVAGALARSCYHPGVGFDPLTEHKCPHCSKILVMAIPSKVMVGYCYHCKKMVDWSVNHPD